MLFLQPYSNTSPLNQGTLKDTRPRLCHSRLAEAIQKGRSTASWLLSGAIAVSVDRAYVMAY